MWGDSGSEINSDGISKGNNMNDMLIGMSNDLYLLKDNVLSSITKGFIYGTTWDDEFTYLGSRRHPMMGRGGVLIFKNLKYKGEIPVPHIQDIHQIVIHY